MKHKVFFTQKLLINEALASFDEEHPEEPFYSTVTVSNDKFDFCFGTFIKLPNYGWLRWTDKDKKQGDY
jgi:hypothetical protein